MKKGKVIALLFVVTLCLSLLGGAAQAGDKIAVKGTIVSFDLDKRMVVVDVDGEEMTFYVDNDVAFFKLDDRLWEGDEVKIRYVVEDGKKVIKEANDLRGTKPGC